MSTDFTEEVTEPRAEGSGVTIDDFVAYMPGHVYIFTPSREVWPASSVNARLKPMPVLTKDGNLNLVNAQDYLSPAEKRYYFDQIINSAFAIKSQHSSLIQVADAVSYAYRRHLELKSDREAWQGEQEYFAGLVGKLEPKRERLGRTPGGLCIEFYKAVRHQEWTL